VYAEAGIDKGLSIAASMSYSIRVPGFVAATGFWLKYPSR
jgi:hypothetical protein